MGFASEDAFLMCASCWRIQPREDELIFEVDHWVDPTTFMARMAGQQAVKFIDTYCTACLIESAQRRQSARQRASSEPLNA